MKRNRSAEQIERADSEFTCRLVEAIWLTGQVDMMLAAQRTLGAILNGAIALQAMRIDPAVAAAAVQGIVSRMPAKRAPRAVGGQGNVIEFPLVPLSS